MFEDAPLDLHQVIRTRSFRIKKEKGDPCVQRHALGKIEAESRVEGDLQLLPQEMLTETTGGGKELSKSNVW